MANIIAHWSLNEPSENPIRIWDNSGKGNHGDALVMPAVVSDSPCGTRAMKWTSGGENTSVSLPELNPVALSYWIKDDKDWKFIAVSNGKAYENAVESGSMTTSMAKTNLETMMAVPTSDFLLSDIYYFDGNITAAEIEKMYKVKTRIANDASMYSKEFKETVQANVGVNKAGIVKSRFNELDPDSDSMVAAFKSDDTGSKVNVKEIIEY